MKWLCTLGLLLFPCVLRAESISLSAPENAPIQDVSVLVLTKAYSKLNLKIRVDYIPNKRALRSANQGVYDGEVSRVKGASKQFKNLIMVPVPINILYGQSFAVDSSLEINAWGDLQNYSLICVRGVKFVEFALKQHGLTCFEAGSTKIALKMVQMGRYDVAVLPKINGLKFIHEEDLKGVYPVGKELAQLELFHFLHKKNKHLLAPLTKVLSEMHESGEIAKIRALYLNEASTGNIFSRQ